MRKASLILLGILAVAIILMLLSSCSARVIQNRMERKVYNRQSVKKDHRALRLFIYFTFSETQTIQP